MIATEIPTVERASSVSIRPVESDKESLDAEDLISQAQTFVLKKDTEITHPNQLGIIQYLQIMVKV